MNNLFISFLVLVILLIFLTIQFKYVRKLKIATKKSLGENISFLIGIAAMVIITCIYGRKIVDYTIGMEGIILLALEFFKQGIFEEGIMLVARGKEIYNWGDIRKVEVVKKGNIKVTYFINNGLIITHKFTINNYNEIIEKFISNNIDFEIKYN